MKSKIKNLKMPYMLKAAYGIFSPAKGKAKEREKVFMSLDLATQICVVISGLSSIGFTSSLSALVLSKSLSGIWLTCATLFICILLFLLLEGVLSVLLPAFFDIAFSDKDPLAKENRSIAISLVCIFLIIGAQITTTSMMSWHGAAIPVNAAMGKAELQEVKTDNKGIKEVNDFYASAIAEAKEKDKAEIAKIKKKHKAKIKQYTQAVKDDPKSEWAKNKLSYYQNKQEGEIADYNTDTEVMKIEKQRLDAIASAQATQQTAISQTLDSNKQVAESHAAITNVGIGLLKYLGAGSAILLFVLALIKVSIKKSYKLIDKVDFKRPSLDKTKKSNRQDIDTQIYTNDDQTILSRGQTNGGESQTNQEDNQTYFTLDQTEYSSPADLDPKARALFRQHAKRLQRNANFYRKIVDGDSTVRGKASTYKQHCLEAAVELMKINKGLAEDKIRKVSETYNIQF